MLAGYHISIKMKYGNNKNGEEWGGEEAGKRGREEKEGERKGLDKMNDECVVWKDELMLIKYL